MKLNLSRVILTASVSMGLLFSGVAHSTAVVTTTVTTVGQYGNGNLYIGLGATLAEPGCSAARVDIASTHPLIKQIMAMALSAKAAGTNVKVRSVGCLTFTYNGASYTFPTMDSTNTSFFGNE
jgi:hypothetical protein